MDSIDQAILKSAQETADLDSRLREIFEEHYRLKAENEQPADYMAYGMLAVDISIRLANMFISIRKNKGVHRVACDLTYQMNTNIFWQKNANVLMPIMHVCLNTFSDGAQLVLERMTAPEYASGDILISASRAAPLEIFPIVAYLLGGPELMVSVSLPLKRALAPYFLS